VQLLEYKSDLAVVFILFARLVVFRRYRDDSISFFLNEAVLRIYADVTPSNLSGCSNTNSAVQHQLNGIADNFSVSTGRTSCNPFFFPIVNCFYEYSEFIIPKVIASVRGLFARCLYFWDIWEIADYSLLFYCNAIDD